MRILDCEIYLDNNIVKFIKFNLLKFTIQIQLNDYQLLINKGS